MATVKSYEDLQVWQRAMQLVEHVYALTEIFPSKENFRLTDQLCRAVVSVPSNIAEGSKRHTTREYARFVGIAQGTLAEVETQLIIAKRLAYIDDNRFQPVIDSANEVGRLLGGLYNALERKLTETPSPSLAPALAPI
jgi:four helix bundle protein